jgi:hypothetical protein
MSNASVNMPRFYIDGGVVFQCVVGPSSIQKHSAYYKIKIFYLLFLNSHPHQLINHLIYLHLALLYSFFLDINLISTFRYQFKTFTLQSWFTPPPKSLPLL